MDDRIKVWPLMGGLKGTNAFGDPVDLVAGVPGWMNREEAEIAINRNEVMQMAGASQLTLNRALRAGMGRPRPEPKEAVVEVAGEVFTAAEIAAEEEIVPEPRKRRGRPPRGRYARSDMKAEDT